MTEHGHDTDAIGAAISAAAQQVYAPDALRARIEAERPARRRARPARRPLFAGADLRRQKAMLLSALVLVRKSLRDLPAIVPTLHKLGARHVAYGARPEHYPVVASVLIASMAEVAGPAWQPHHGRAWAAALDVVAGAMLEGAATAELDIAA